MEAQYHDDLALALSGLSHRGGHELRSLFFHAPRTTFLGKPLKCRAAARVRARIAITPPQYHCAAAAVQLYKQYYHTPSFITPQTHAVGVRTCYHTPPLIHNIFNTPTRPVGV